MKVSRVPLFLVLFLLVSAARAADITWTYSPTASTTNEQTISGITITPTYNWKTTPSVGNSSGMLQIGSTGKNAISVQYAFSAFPAKIKSVVVTGKTAANNSGNTTVSGFIGTDPLDGSMSLTNAEGSITLTPSTDDQSGNLSLTISNPRANTANSSSQAIYLRSIVVTYQNPNDAELDPGLEWATIFDEGFGGMTSTTSWGSQTKILSSEGNLDAALTDRDTWYGNTLYNAPSAPRFGHASSHGWMRSPGILLSNGVSSATVKVTFSAIALHDNAASALVFSVLDANGAELAISGVSPVSLTLPIVTSPTSGSTVATELTGVGGSAQSFTFTAPDGFRLKFDTSSAKNSNVALDDILVEQVIDPLFAPLAAPTGLTSNTVEKYSFTVSWNGVEHATGYEVWLDNEPVGYCDTTSTNLTGLADGTTYSVQVKALGDNLHYGDSPLSTAISVTTSADAQKIDFTVTGAPAGDVFAGDAVAFTVTAEVESTHESAPVSFAGNIAGATFIAATGAFSWTTTEGDVGSHTATFTSGTYSTNVAITVSSATETRTLATENFSKITSTSWTSTTGYANRMDGDIGTWTGLDLIKTKSAVIIGRGESSGTIVSPAIDLPVRTPGSLTVSFDTGSISNKTASVQARILDAADDSVLYTTNFPSVARLPLDATAVSDAGARFTVAPGANVALPASIRFSLTTYESTGVDSQRAYIDTVVFAQTLSARLRDLDAPTGLAVVGEPGETGFSVGWTAVSDATNYAVRVTDASGAIVFSAPFCAAAPVAVAGLADDVSYAVQVRATGDDAVWTPSPWSEALAVRTARSSAHPTLSFGGWINAMGDGGLYAGLANTAAVSAVRDNGSNAVVTLSSVLPAPAVGPTLAGDVLSWTPVDADTNKTFTVSFLMDGTYETNLSFKIKDIAPLAPPTVTVAPVAWDSFGLSWNAQYRAAGYAVRVWTDCPNPSATETRIDEPFAGFAAGVMPSGWTLSIPSSEFFYKDDKAPVKLAESTHFIKTYDLGGPITNVSFHAAGHSIAGSSSTLTVVGIRADDTETVLATLTASEIGQTATGIDRTCSVPAGVRKIAWRYTKDSGGVGVGSVVIEGEGFSTARWLPGWGPAEKDVGLVQVCTVAKPRPGKVLGVNPANKKEDLTEDRINYAEVAVHDAAGATLATVVEVEVPAPPRSARATLLIFR